MAADTPRILEMGNHIGRDINTRARDKTWIHYGNHYQNHILHKEMRMRPAMFYVCRRSKWIATSVYSLVDFNPNCFKKDIRLTNGSIVKRGHSFAYFNKGVDILYMGSSACLRSLCQLTFMALRFPD